ncbi:ATP synthase subunit B family protein [Muricoccus pecuniae]|uniref:Uncharacterized protein n=1 Tax=Muricoccus pecuniae TaxID=693023 RepID=A0A840YGT6_9PROT|nr:hypothetical protein [Roseomonas pecuniae]MBB5695521.1 hypothetical protein [Roseomonas pecuniae]
MDIKKLLGLRPKAQTAEAIRAAIAAAEEGRSAALVRIAELEAGRGNLLLNGEVRAVENGERDLAEARAEAERCEVVATALRPTLEQAINREKAEEMARLRDEVVSLSAAFVTFWREKYPALATQIRDGAMLEARAVQKLNELAEMTVMHPAAQAVGDISLPPQPADLIFPGDPSNAGGGVTSRISMPHPDGRIDAVGSPRAFLPLPRGGH